MTPRELKLFKEMERLRAENKELMIMQGIWALLIVMALLLTWG